MPVVARCRHSISNSGAAPGSAPGSAPGANRGPGACANTRAGRRRRGRRAAGIIARWAARFAARRRLAAHWHWHCAVLHARTRPSQRLFDVRPIDAKRVRDVPWRVLGVERLGLPHCSPRAQGRAALVRAVERAEHQQVVGVRHLASVPAGMRRQQASASSECAISAFVFSRFSAVQDAYRVRRPTALVLRRMRPCSGAKYPLSTHEHETNPRHAERVGCAQPSSSQQGPG